MDGAQDENGQGSRDQRSRIALQVLVWSPIGNKLLVALGRPMPPLVLSDDEVQQLQALASSRSLPHSIVRRAQIVLACGAGETNTVIAKRMGLTGMTVGKWRKRYRELGLEGPHDELRPGRPRTYEDHTVAEVINRALQTRPDHGRNAVNSRLRSRLLVNFDKHSTGSPWADKGSRPKLK
ncbi:MAG: helix-turn-helix domain-containing protein [Cyanobium sp. Prado107]|jgi:transposase|nr:helix-turn-helix domain-containing protein [Cyanobium sp. Prado107]